MKMVSQAGKKSLVMSKAPIQFGHFDSLTSMRKYSMGHSQSY